MPPIGDNGIFAFFITIRPRIEEFTDSFVKSTVSYVLSLPDLEYNFIVQEGHGDDYDHLHLVLFFAKGKKRENLCAMIANSCLKECTPETVRNFKKWRTDGSASVKAATSLDLITSYLSGEHSSKLGDPNTVLSNNLPEEDLSSLEQYLPAVDGLKKKRNISIWYAQQKKYFLDDYPDVPISEATVLMFLKRRMFTTKDMDVISDPRILRQKCRALVSYMTNDEDPTYSDGASPFDVFLTDLVQLPPAKIRLLP